MASVSSVRPPPSIPSTSTASSSSAATSSTSSSSGGGWLQTGMNLLGSVFGGGGAQGSGGDQTKAMIDSFIFGNLEKMRDEAQKKLEEAMKKRGG